VESELGTQVSADRGFGATNGDHAGTVRHVVSPVHQLYCLSGSDGRILTLNSSWKRLHCDLSSSVHHPVYCYYYWANNRHDDDDRFCTVLWQRHL